MRISELSSRSGVRVETIKYYIREGLLPRGTTSAATRAEYDGLHLERLRLIRALREVGHLSIAAIKKIVAAVDDDQADLHHLLGTAQYALAGHTAPPDDSPDRRQARREADAIVGELGWRVEHHSPARDMLAQALAALRAFGMPTETSRLRRYAEAVHRLAEDEVGGLPADMPREQAVRTVVASTVLHEQALIALRRMAQEDVSARRFGDHAPPP